MSDLTTVAHLIDRPVWAVSGGLKERQSSLVSASRLAPSTFGPLINLLPFRGQLTESVVLRRYIYRDPEAMLAYVHSLVDAGLMTRDGDELHPTDFLNQLAIEANQAVDAVCAELWGGTAELAHEISDLARRVLDAATDRHGLVQGAQELTEPSDPLHCLWWRLTALRLVRNEAHVDAWTAEGLSASDVEVLTSAWAGTKTQGETLVSETLTNRGYVVDETVTEAGLQLRADIEDATDAGVRAAYDAVDTTLFATLLADLPPLD